MGIPTPSLPLETSGKQVSPRSPLSSSAAMNFNGATNKTVLDRYLALKQPDDITQCMYVWIDGTGEHLRAKTKTVKFVPKKPSELPIWNYDSSCSVRPSSMTRAQRRQ